jgi:hypothetical protein
MHDAFVGTDLKYYINSTHILELPIFQNASVTAAISAAQCYIVKNYIHHKKHFETKHKQATIEGSTAEVNAGHQYVQMIANEIFRA